MSTEPSKTDDPYTRLQVMRGETMTRVSELSQELDSVATAISGSNIDDEHDPEGATLAFEREQLSAFRAQAERHLIDIEAAIDRILQGTYGYCESCGAPIAAARLDALPAVRLCLTCAAA